MQHGTLLRKAVREAITKPHCGWQSLSDPLSVALVAGYPLDADAVLADNAVNRKKQQDYEHFTDFLPAGKWRQIAAAPGLAFDIIMEYVTLSLGLRSTLEPTAQKLAAVIAI